MTSPSPSPLSTTGIGSLPHSQRELALQLALAVDIPYVPQLPQRDPAEFMIPQALQGLPGLSYDDQGNVALDADAWVAESGALSERLAKVLATDGEVWEPAASHWAGWQPFAWEVKERRAPFAKAQMAGPVTTRWALRTGDGRASTEVDGLDRQVLELILARLLSMVRVLKASTQPIVFLDEPGLFALNPDDPKQIVAVKELEVVIESLKKEGALVGLHCCSNTAWDALLTLGLDYLAVDGLLSLLPLVQSSRFDDYVRGGGGLLLGIVPTNTDVNAYNVGELVDTSMAALRQHEERGGVTAEQVLSRTILSPACGLAMRSVPDSEKVFDDLRRAREMILAAQAA